ncbi:MAG: MBL fold metallo-hydrolase [Proteobacteria bacterium]|nr:MBL fold metallo-hydrolase [Pseudomonadota bacterium]MBU1740360.1 MBL fold metallo-hydrolase [Pseudomonadota bacterium]
MSGKRFAIVAAILVTAAAVCLGRLGPAAAAQAFETDVIKTKAGDLKITFIRHGTLMFTFGGKVIHVDPWTKVADYAKLPKADLILITHHHYDHLDAKAIQAVRTPRTVIVASALAAAKVKGAMAMKNGEKKRLLGLVIEAVPAYNIVGMRRPGVPWHPKGEGNGYVITFGGKRVYVAGDTENVPEMKGLQKIDVAFLPMNLPYTMTPKMVADAAKAFRPKILYPYHFGKTDTSQLLELMKGVKGVEVRIRKMGW